MHTTGAILGALCGDALGGVLEMMGRPPSPREIDHAFTLPGGGVWQLAPGQITDDGELTLCQMHGLTDRPEDPTEGAARRYADWIRSRPFDIGGTTANSLGVGASARENVAAAMRAAAAARCMGSKANGALMRATPLGVWGASRPDEAVIAAAREDARLSHPNPACVDANAAYVLAIARLIRNPGDVSGALAAREVLETEEVRGWFADAEVGQIPACTPQDGFVKIAFTLAFFHLSRRTPWERAIRETLEGGGDTDTNAAIVGGLLGALHGVEAIPAAVRAGVLGCDTRGAHPRPGWLRPGEALRSPTGSAPAPRCTP